MNAAVSVLFGICGHVEPPDAARYCTALGHYPTVGGVGRYRDDNYFVAQGLKASGIKATGPYIAEDQGHVLAMDGWIANRADLGRSLGLIGNLPPDRVMVAAALLRWGREALVKLHGDFALAWWDGVNRRLLLAVDRTGGRPIFYHHADWGLVFANLSAPLFLHRQVPRVLDPDMVARAMFAASHDLANTCFRGVRQLLPGHMLEWTAAAGVRVSRYWQLDPSRRLRLKRDEDYVDAARELLDMVVREALPTEGKVVSMLSGGLDSGAVATTIARLTAPVPLHTITMRPDPGGVLPADGHRQIQDEWALAQATARMHPSIVAHGVTATIEPFEDVLRASFQWGGRPPVHLMAATWFAAGWRQARELGASTVFIGRSGNATLSASNLSRDVKPGILDLPQALHMVALAASNGKGVKPYIRAFILDRLRHWRADLGGSAPVWPRQTALRPEAGASIGMDAVWRAHIDGDRRASWAQRARLSLMERTWMTRTLTTCLHLRDGVERRDPLGDARLAEFCFAIPPDQFTRLGNDRYLARRVLADRLPLEVLRERRSGRQFPEWFDWASRKRDWLSAELDGIETSALGRELIDVPRLRGILAAWPENAEIAEPEYVRLMNVLGRGVAVGSFIRWAEGSNM